MATEKRLIEANALAEHIKDLPTWWADDGGFYGGAMKYPEGMFIPEDIISSIKNAPTVDAVEVVHGRWNDFADKYDKSAKKHDFRCSVCNKRASMFVGGTEDWWDMWKPNYCPHCGAKMDGERRG